MTLRGILEISVLSVLLAGCGSAPVSSPAPAEIASATDEKPVEPEVDAEPQRIYTRITCKKDKEIQILEIDSTPTQGCVLIHTKGKKRHKLRHSPNSRKPCQGQRDEMLADLKSRSFACEEPSPITSR